MSYLSFARVDVPVETSDKINHLVAFVVFSVLFIICYRKIALSKVLIASFLFGIYIEAVQYFLPYRSCELMDVVADLTGAFLGWVLFVLIIKKMLKIQIT